jgi:hypothetical protein
MVTRFSGILVRVINDPERGAVYAGSNVTDQEQDWAHNYRCPDVVVLLRFRTTGDHRVEVHSTEPPERNWLV